MGRSCDRRGCSSITASILDRMTSTAGDPQFHTTHWSLIAAAAGEGGEPAQAALEEVCRAYWYPVYAFIRRRGRTAEDAGDLTQAFFATLLEKEYLADA